MEGPSVAAEEYVYDVGADAGLVLRELVPNMHTAGPQKCFRERAVDDATGWTIWSSSVLQARWIMEHRELFRGRDVLELGAGCGLSGIAVASACTARSVCLSDYAKETMENLLWNVARNCTPAEPSPAVDSGCEVALVGTDDDATAAVGAASSSAPTISIRIGEQHFDLSSTFRSRTGTTVSLAQMDWDEPGTWPRARGGGEYNGPTAPESRPTQCATSDPGALHATYDVILAADLFYRRSYSRKVASAVQRLLRPGGLFICCTPAAREGLGLLDSLMASPAAGFSAEETKVPSAWRVNPLRTPGSPLPPRVADSVGGGGRVSDGGAGAAASAAAAASPEVRLVDDEEARTMFPELFVPMYEIVTIVYSRKGEGEAGSGAADETEG